MLESVPIPVRGIVSTKTRHGKPSNQHVFTRSAYIISHIKPSPSRTPSPLPTTPGTPTWPRPVTDLQVGQRGAELFAGVAELQRRRLILHSRQRLAHAVHHLGARLHKRLARLRGTRGGQPGGVPAGHFQGRGGAIRRRRKASSAGTSREGIERRHICTCGFLGRSVTGITRIQS